MNSQWSAKENVRSQKKARSVVIVFGSSIAHRIDYALDYYHAVEGLHCEKRYSST